MTQRRALCDACTAYVVAPDNGTCPNCGNPIPKENYDPVLEPYKPPVSVVFPDPPQERVVLQVINPMMCSSEPHIMSLTTDMF